MMNRYLFEIADFVIELKTELPLQITDPFLPFFLPEDSKKDPDYVAIARQTDWIKPADAVYEGDCFSVGYAKDSAQDLKREERYFFPDTVRKEEIYAHGRYDFSSRRVDLVYLPEGIRHLNQTGNFFYHIAFEKLLLEEDRVILHSCFVNTELGGICFSGDSGVGKSTQGNLWKQHKAAAVINGDRTILYKKDGVWMGAGSPYAGSSNLHIKESHPIRAIVMLKQSPDNQIRRLGEKEAFVKVFPQMTINTWSRDYLDRVTRRIEEIVTELPVFELSCRPDAEAVDLLCHILEEVSR